MKAKIVEGSIDFAYEEEQVNKDIDKDGTVLYPTKEPIKTFNPVCIVCNVETIPGIPEGAVNFIAEGTKIPEGWVLHADYVPKEALGHIDKDGTIHYPSDQKIQAGKEQPYFGKRPDVIIIDDVVNPGKSPWVSVKRYGYPSCSEDFVEFEVFCYNVSKKYTFRAIVPIEEGLLLPPVNRNIDNCEIVYWRPLDADPTEEQIKLDEQALIDEPKLINEKN